VKGVNREETLGTKKKKRVRVKRKTPAAPLKKGIRVKSSRRIVRATGVVVGVGVLWIFLLGPMVRMAVAAIHLDHDFKTMHGTGHFLPTLTRVMPQIELSVATLDDSLSRLGYWSAVPGIGGVYRALDGLASAGRDEIQVIGTLLPHLSVHQGSGTLETVAENLPQLAPALLAVQPELRRANRAFSIVNPNALGILGANTVNEVATLKNVTASFTKNLPTIESMLPTIQSLLGIPSLQRYWLVFENSGELRPTGGFMTAYGDMPLSGGKIGKIVTHNIYGLYLGTTYRPPAPAMFTAAFGVQHWHMEDANTSPDVPLTVDNIYRFYDSIPTAPKPLDGVVFITTWFVDRLIGDFGGIQLGAPYNVDITAANANYEMEYLSEKDKLIPNDKRKAFIGVMLHDLMHRVFHESPTELLRVAGTIDTALNQKLLLVYFNNPQAESLANRYDWGGVIPSTFNGNYLQEVDENLGGHKDNYYMKEAVSSTIVPDGNQYQETVDIRWTNPAIYNDWTVVPYQAYVRLYVPPTATLVGVNGEDAYFTDYYNATENKNVFGGEFHMGVRQKASDPPATWTMQITYLLPGNTNIDRYLIQKQPGVLSQEESVDLEGHRYQFSLTHDTLLTYTGHGWIARPYR